MSVAVIMGSKSDFPAVKSAFETLKKFGVPFVGRVLSAHRTPEEAADFALTARTKGIKVIICAAGMAAHLAGVVAGHTTIPVIGIPVASTPFSAVDATLATLQMPPGVPVATVTAGGAGAKNAALLAIEMLAISDEVLAGKLAEFRMEQKNKVLQADAELQQELSLI